MMLTLSLRSDDEMFHVTLYSWLLSDSVNMADKLIEVCFQQFKIGIRISRMGLSLMEYVV